MKLNTGAWLLVLGAGWVVGGEGQNSAVVDEATMVVTKAGARLGGGRESFRIVRSPGAGGQVYVATGTSALGSTRLLTRLTTDSNGAPVTYELRVLQQNEQQLYLQLRGQADRLSVLMQTKGGEAVREYLARKGTAVLDDEVVHELYFVVLAAMASPDSSVTVISPRETTQRRYRLEFKGIEAVLVGRQNLTGRRFALTDVASTRAEVWIDALGRLLKASVPDKALVALRDDPPR